MSKSRATLLGVPRDTLLRAMEIVGLDADIFIARHDIGLDTYSVGDLEHAFREWLGKEGCSILIMSNTVVTRGKLYIASNPHHLTAQAMVVVKIGGTDARP